MSETYNNEVATSFRLKHDSYIVDTTARGTGVQ